MTVLFGENATNFWNVIMKPAILSTLEMLIITTILGTILGSIIAAILIITNNKGIRPNKLIYNILNFIVNMVRSFPFIILMVFLLPVTKEITGASMGVKAAIVPLTVSATAFIAKIIENAMQEVDPTLIEAMDSFGLSDKQIILGVILSEAAPSIVSGIIVATITILSATAMAGAVGAGGIGAAAITYGYQSFDYGVMYAIAGILIIFVEVIQRIGDYIYHKMK